MLFFSIGTDIGYDSVGIKCDSMIISVKNLRQDWRKAR